MIMQTHFASLIWYQLHTLSWNISQKSFSWPTKKMMLTSPRLRVFQFQHRAKYFILEVGHMASRHWPASQGAESFSLVCHGRSVPQQALTPAVICPLSYGCRLRRDYRWSLICKSCVIRSFASHKFILKPSPEFTPNKSSSGRLFDWVFAQPEAILPFAL